MKTSHILFVKLLLASSLLVNGIYGYVLSTKFTSKMFNHRQVFLVMHYTVSDFDQSVDILTNKLSTHYLVPEGLHGGERVVYRMVPEEKRAWTQGKSAWGKRSNLNDQGISIEIVNRGYTINLDGTVKWYPFPNTQIDSIIELSREIITRYDIKPNNVIGHADCAPVRKEDPGPLFPWKRLYDNGIGAWPEESDVKEFKKRLSGITLVVKDYVDALIGYGYHFDQKNPVEIKAAVSKFQMHFRNRKFDGVMDVETFAILKALLRKYHGKYRKVLIDLD